MKAILRILVLGAIAFPILTSCSGGSASKASLFGSLPAEHEQFQAEKDAIKAKAKDIKTEADKAKLIAESQEMEEKWAAKIEETAKSLDGKPIGITDSEIKVTTPLSLTFDGFFSKSDLTPLFKINGSAKAAADITPEGEYPRAVYSVYIVGYDATGQETFSSKIGHITAEQTDNTAVIKAGTPVNFESLQFSGKKAADYQLTETLKLEVR